MVGVVSLEGAVVTINLVPSEFTPGAFVPKLSSLRVDASHEGPRDELLSKFGTSIPKQVTACVLHASISFAL